MICDDFFLTRNNPREFAWKKLLIDDLRSACGNMVSENAVLGVFLLCKTRCLKKMPPPTRPSFTHNLIFGNHQKIDLPKR